MVQDKLTRDAARGHEKGKGRWQYDLSAPEIDKLFKEAMKNGGADGFFKAICTAYDCGFERGIRMTKNDYKRKTRRKAAAE